MDMATAGIPGLGGVLFTAGIAWGAEAVLCVTAPVAVLAIGTAAIAAGIGIGADFLVNKYNIKQ